MTAVSFKDSGMLLSDWIKVNQNAKKRIDVSRIDVTSRSGYTSYNSNSNSPYLTHRSTENVAVNSQTKTYKMRIGSSDSNYPPSENSSVQSAQSLPSVYVKKMKLDAFDSNAHLKPENNLHGKIYQKNNNVSKAAVPLAAQHWYKLTRKSSIVKVQNNSLNSNTQESHSGIQINETKTESINQVNETTEVAKNSNIQSSQSVNQINETQKVVRKSVISTGKLVDTATCVVAATVLVNASESKVNEINVNQSKQENASKAENRSKIDKVKEKSEVDKIVEVSSVAAVAVVLKEGKEVKKSGKEEKQFKKEIKEEIKETSKREKKSNKNNKPTNKNVDKDKSENFPKSSTEDQFAKVIRDLDEIIENDLNNLTSNDDNVAPDTEPNKLLDKILSKEFQSNVDNFLRSNEYQESFYESCKNLTQ